MDSPVVVARALTKDFKVAQKASGPLSTLRHFVRRRYRLVRAVDSAILRDTRGGARGHIGCQRRR